MANDNTAPMTDAQLAEINNLKASVAFDGIHVDFDEETAWFAILDLRREVARQRAVIAEQQAELAAMRPIVEMVAKWGIGGGMPVEYYYQARAYVAAHPATTTTETVEGEGE